MNSQLALDRAGYMIMTVRNTSATNSRLPAVMQWTAPGRFLVFILAATSIWCLLAEMYGLVDMRTFFFTILLPATAILYGIAFLDNARGEWSSLAHSPA